MQSKVGDDVPDEGKVLFPELMLTGFAIECILKAIWIKHGNKLAVGGKYVGVKVADHALLQLADAVRLRLDGNARDVLKRLSIIMTSAVGTRFHEIGRRERLKLHGGGKGIPEFWQHPRDDQLLEKVFAILQKELGT